MMMMMIITEILNTILGGTSDWCPWGHTTDTMSIGPPHNIQANPDAGWRRTVSSSSVDYKHHLPQPSQHGDPYEKEQQFYTVTFQVILRIIINYE